MLIVFGGLPGTGKTTLSRALAFHLAATWLRVDAIEQAIRDAGLPPAKVGAAGYGVAQAVAEANLGPGRIVVADAVNPVREARSAWRAIAARAGAGLVEVELVCSDPAEHRRRVETRASDIPGLMAPAWRDVVERRYEPWTEPHLVVDTARTSTEAAMTTILEAIESARPR